MKLIIKRFEELSADELYRILKVRFEIFVIEQECIYPEIDGNDQHSYHVYLEDDTGIKAYLRVVDRGISHEEVSIGRVLTTERGIGLGNRILSEGIRVARERMNADKIVIEAQSYAKEYYEKFGFRQVSEEYVEDGIPHMQMILE
ncbi:GNAT family N-acetyltransferase [Gudongella sp. SC589]|uniref:GNAT family N-acetyltransferase n=1 Tax=Gudongella sp. SC589 TaxID=3385990 RepID=UPI003904AE0E